jgi:hypothetical protein
MHNFSMHNGDGDGVQFLHCHFLIVNPFFCSFYCYCNCFVIGHVGSFNKKGEKEHGNKNKEKERKKTIIKRKEATMIEARASSLMVFFFFFSFPSHNKL